MTEISEPPLRYRVIGPLVVAGKTCGQLIDTPLPDAQADALITAGHIRAEPVPAPKKTGRTRPVIHEKETT